MTREDLKSGAGWTLFEDSEGVWLEVSCTHLTVSHEGKHCLVRLDPPAGLATVIQGKPAVKVLDAPSVPLKSSWIRFLAILFSEGITSRHRARMLEDLPGCHRSPQMRGSAIALWRRGYVGREVLTEKNGASFYWLTDKGIEIFKEIERP